MSLHLISEVQNSVASRMQRVVLKGWKPQYLSLLTEVCKIYHLVPCQSLRQYHGYKETQL